MWGQRKPPRWAARRGQITRNLTDSLHFGTRPKVSEPAPRHESVLTREVCRALTPVLGRRTTNHRGGGGTLVDATTGLGGHVVALLAQVQPDRVVALDRDPEALAIARERLADQRCPITWIDAPFSELRARLAELGITGVEAILADLGVSSIQLDQGRRGFSFRASAPLDMRMDPRRSPSAAEVLAAIDEASLTRLLRDYGEEPDARRIAAAICRARPTTTGELADVVATAMSAPQRRKLGTRVHPATRTFQALRIHVNDELGELDRLLHDGPELLNVGGRMAVISFHPRGGRVDKRGRQEPASPLARPPAIRRRARELPRPRRAIVQGFAGGVAPSDEELDSNPRARSARLRVLERIAS